MELQKRNRIVDATKRETREDTDVLLISLRLTARGPARRVNGGERGLSEQFGFRSKGSIV